MIHRFWRPNFDLFPSCDSVARDTASRLVKKLQSLGSKGVSHCARELSFKVQTSFDKGRIRWATAEDFEGTHHYLPQCCVNNLNSASSPLRLVVVPNRPIFVSKQIGMRTYNSFIRKTSLELPSFLKFSLVTALSAESILDRGYLGCVRVGRSLGQQPEAVAHLLPEGQERASLLRPQPV